MVHVRNMVLCGFLCSFAGLPALASSGAGASVCGRVTIKAPLKNVWEAMRTLRKTDPEHRKIISSMGGDYVVEENFGNLPVIGETICTYKEHEIPMKRLEYSMLSSEKLKAFEGAWSLTPSADDKETLVELSSLTETGLRIPFAGSVTRARTLKSIDSRLSSVKAIAESPGTNIASNIRGAR